jgi:hypothetical protein
MTQSDPFQIWRGFHWSFFLNTQGLIICLRRFEVSLLENNLAQAQIELETATALMLASGAAMELAGSFAPQLYEHEVRPTMMPPHVKSHDFSGLMSWEHAVLVQLWKRLRSTFLNLPDALQSQYQAFAEAYLSLASSHRCVCQKFGGEQVGSLRFDRGNALETLDAFTRSRYHLIHPEQSIEQSENELS